MANRSTEGQAAAATTGGTILEVKNLSMFYQTKSACVRAVNDVSFSIQEGETFGLVGESGCGKSTLARTITNLYRPTEGKVVFEGTDFAALSKKELRARRTDIQMIFQDPYSSLNPA